MRGMVLPPRAAASRLLTCLAVIALVACAGEDGPVASEEAFATANAFDRDLVLSDEALEDADAFDVAQIQAFLENTPHGNRSVLADVKSNGVTAAQAYYDAGQKYGINPLVLLTRSQLEQGLISKKVAAAGILDWAMGCGCPDGRECYDQFRGFDRQIECAAERLRTYLDEINDAGKSISGWGVGIRKNTLEGDPVTPRNRATAALYTYTPWASSAKNHAAIWRKYALTTGFVAAAPGGCEVATFSSGMRVQLRPAADADPSAEPRCFVDSWQLVDPVEHLVWRVEDKVSDNFTFSEYASRASDKEMLLDVALVEVVQSVRSRLGAAVSIERAFQNPEAHMQSCGNDCDATVELTLGTGVVVSSRAGGVALLKVAADVGVPSCFELDGGVFIGVGPDAQGCPR